MMTIFATADIVTGLFGKELVINDIVFNSFVIITLGAFGIAEAGKIFAREMSDFEKLLESMKEIDQTTDVKPQTCNLDDDECLNCGS
jgi:hypothetical protein